jgi:hypothetical protein
MTTSSTTEAKDLLTLAGRMSIPVEEALRQVAQLIDLGPSVENATVRRTPCTTEVIRMGGT